MGAPQPPGHAAIKLADWPAGDLAAYERACIPGSPFERGGAAARWRPASHKALVSTYGRYLGYLAGQGVDLLGTSPVDRMTPERMVAYIRFLADRCASVTVSSYLGQLHMFARDVWPERDWRWLCAMQAERHRMAEPVRIKAARIVPQQDLLRLGCDLMVQAEELETVEGDRVALERQAALFRDGLVIALLALRPLRQKNFLAIVIGRHLVDGPGGWTLVVPSSESKTHIELRMAVPHILVPALQAYLKHHRPRLLEMRAPRDPVRPWRSPGQHLWIASTGMPMTPGALHKALRRHTVARFGHEVNCHLFRDCLATSLADDNPEAVRLAADLLGHRSFRTTAKHYIAANQKSALRRHQAGVAARRRETSRADPGESR